jgi:hypothetical protein
MSVAFKDVQLWRGYLSNIEDLRDQDAVMQALARFQWERKNTHSFVVNVLANALYSLFAAGDGVYLPLKQNRSPDSQWWPMTPLFLFALSRKFGFLRHIAGWLMKCI